MKRPDVDTIEAWTYFQEAFHPTKAAIASGRVIALRSLDSWRGLAKLLAPGEKLALVNCKRAHGNV